MFYISMLCYGVDPKVAPYTKQVDKRFQTREEAMSALETYVENEVTLLNSGNAEGEFRGTFVREDHDAVVEFWEGEPTEGDRDMRPVTIYDIWEV